jgi:uncharacterized membrane protein YeaQ/YmgE (transglycosylase-associated protein family)
MDILSIDSLGIVAVGVVAGLAFRPIAPASPFRGAAINVGVGVAGSVVGFSIAVATGLFEKSMFAGLLAAVAGAVLPLVLLRLARRYSTR